MNVTIERVNWYTLHKTNQNERNEREGRRRRLAQTSNENHVQMQFSTY